LGIDEFFYPMGRPSNLIFVTKNAQGQRCQKMRTMLLSELVDRGILGPSLVVGYSHDDTAVHQTLNAFHDALKTYKRALGEGVDKILLGPASKPAIRKYN
jgi:glutamate-1-semialdehyde 2,1-aminomutase